VDQHRRCATERGDGPADQQTEDTRDDDLDTESGLRLIVDTTPALIYSSRPDGFIDFFNQRSVEFLGLPLEEISGWGWTKLIHPDDIEGLLAKWRRALQVGYDIAAALTARVSL
jgi:PAS domain S-box-containing protein